MGKILSKYLTSGIKLTKDITDDDGVVIFNRGQEITKKDIDNLIANNINTVTVDEDDLFQFRSQLKINEERRQINTFKYNNPLLEDLPPIVSKETQTAAIEAVHSTLNNINNGQPLKLAQTQAAVDNIVLEIFENTSSIVNLVNIDDLDDYIFSHSLNVCVLSILIAMELDMNKEMIQKIGVIALLHDIGTTKISKEILNKKSKLTEAEFEEVKKHPLYSYKLISQDSSFDPAAAYGALQHHEKLNGSGYPQKLKGSQITLDAKIISIADVYDALISERPYRERLEPYEAMRIIISGGGTLFYPDIVNSFVKLMSVYPVGSFVKLSGGELAIVTRSSKKSVMMPVVRIMLDTSGEKVSNSEEVDLNYDTRYIVGPINRTSGLLHG